VLFDGESATPSAVRAPTELGAFPVEAPTTEDTWLDWVGGLPALEIGRARLVIVAPHPDDETLACGGLIADASATGRLIEIVAVTDGEQSHPGTPGLAQHRRAEQDRALDHLGARGSVHRLEFPDSGVARRLDELVDRLHRVVGHDAVLVAPWSHDGHSDHDACGGAARRVANATGCRLLAYPVWAWQWATPAEFAGDDWRTLAMTSGAHRAKLAAIAEYLSQTTATYGAVVVSDDMLTRFRRRVEVFARVS
jgi:LmbE family N-acetylglucosaminyl deacetylase